MFLRKAQATTSDPPSGFSEKVLRTLMMYDHPGNADVLQLWTGRLVA